MVTYCSVPKCTSRNAPGVSFHRYPKTPWLRKAWVFKLRTGKTPSTTAVVCSKHFQEQDFVYPVYKSLGYKYRRLTAEAIPSMNLPARPQAARRSSEGSAKRLHKRGTAEPPQLPQPLISPELNPLTTQEDARNSSTNCTVECATAEAAREMEHAEDDGLLISRLCTILTPPEMSAGPSAEMGANASVVPVEGLGHKGAPLEETTCPLETASDIQFSCCFCNYVTREQRGIGPGLNHGSAVLHPFLQKENPKRHPDLRGLASKRSIVLRSSRASKGTRQRRSTSGGDNLPIGNCQRHPI
ncbi:zinc finger protein 260 isoform X1 [Ixodes scapularis]